METNSSGVGRQMTIEEICDKLRANIENIASLAKAAKNNSFFHISEKDTADRPEMLANLTLAYRHLEDARMRIGKVIQAKDGGKSVYSK